MSWFNSALAASITLALIIFTQGFLRHKHHIDGHGTESCCASPRFTRTVLMVVDALRTDFVTSRTDSWPYLQQLVDKGQARIYDARVHPPTVTLPRIKALISGDIPGFIDVLMNFDSNELRQDNLLHQMNIAGRSSVFYGDDTWLKLFPRSFLRSEGTTSFFVSDYTEVDENVTRHLLPELARDDWDMMILHYLGLDHIGHLIGPSSSLVPPKLQEMDQVLKTIHSLLMEKGVKDYLIILCGDHGMAEQGGHGGVSASEVATPMVFITDVTTSHSDTVREMYQIDLVPTLSALLNLPIPQNSLGVVSTSVVEPLIGLKETLAALEANSKQLFQLFKASSSYRESAPIVSQFELLTAQYRSYKAMEMDSVREKKLRMAYETLLLSMREKLASHLVDYDVTAMYFGLILLAVVFCGLLLGDPMWSTVFMTTLTGGGLCAITILYTHCTNLAASHVLCTGPLSTIATGLFTLVAASILSTLYSLPLRLQSGFLESFTTHPPHHIMAVVHSLSMLSSSFIEEEHQLAYFFSTTLVLVCLLFAVLSARSTKTQVLLIAALACMTIARKWNQTGDKWAHLSDIADQLNAPSFNSLKCLLALLSLPLIVFTSCSAVSVASVRYLILISVIAISFFVSQDCGYLSLSHRGHYEANLVYVSCCTMLAIAVYNCYKHCYITSLYTLRTAWILLTALLHRTVNLPLMALITSTEWLLSQTSLSSYNLMHIYYWLGQASFFYQGNSNSPSTVDVSAGYKGLSSYSPVFNAFFILCNTYSGPVFCLMSLCIQISTTSINR